MLTVQETLKLVDLNELINPARNPRPDTVVRG